MSLFIATPCYGGLATVPYMKSVLALQYALTLSGLDHDWYFLDNESLIQRARNTAAARFLESGREKLLFIDADIEFTPEDVSHLWNMNAPVAAGIYPMKKEGAGYAAWIGGKLVEDLSGYNGPVEADYAGTGFMMIDREVLETMREMWPKKAHEDGRMPIPGFSKQQSFAWFDPRVENGVYLSEDYAFCHDCRALDIPIMVDPTIRLIHHGHKAYGHKGTVH